MKKRMIGNVKKALVATLIGIMTIGSVGCGHNEGTVEDKDIVVITREDGSGTKSSFNELIGVEEDGKDKTVLTAEITKSTSVMTQSVAGNMAAIGYVSMGSLSDTVKAINIEGVKPTADNIKNGTYKISRPFNIVTKEDISEVSADFVKYILSKEGAKLIEEAGYISVSEDTEYVASEMEGKISIAGSTSVGPLMQILADKYMELNPNVTIEIQQTGSSAGITSTVEGASDIGMVSRDVKDSEKEKGLTDIRIAMDGIAIIVNKSNTVDNLTIDDIRNIYVGEYTNWNEILESK